MTTNKPDHSGAITWPPVIVSGWFLLGLGLDALLSAPVLPAPTQYVIAAVLAALGGGLAVWAAPQFLRHDTSIHVHRPTSALITSGAYARSRNPLYVGLILLYLAGAAAVDSLWLLALAVPAIVSLQAGVIVREERYLEAKFGEAYRDYARRVRRWL